MQYLGPAVSSGLIVVKLKQILEYRDHVGFENSLPHINQAVIYLRSHNKFCENISIVKGL